MSVGRRRAPADGRDGRRRRRRASASSACTPPSATASACSNTRPGGRLSEEELAAEFEHQPHADPPRAEPAGGGGPGRDRATASAPSSPTSISRRWTRSTSCAWSWRVLIGKLDPVPRTAADLGRVRALLARCEALASRPGYDQKMLARMNMDFFQELRAMTGNAPLREISDRLYIQTNAGLAGVCPTSTCATRPRSSAARSPTSWRRWRSATWRRSAISAAATSR